jgi:hypothetical protein
MMTQDPKSEQSLDSRLDAALEMTFPASDPVAVHTLEPPPTHLPQANEKTPPNDTDTVAADNETADARSSSDGYSRHRVAVRILTCRRSRPLGTGATSSSVTATYSA